MSHSVDGNAAVYYRHIVQYGHLACPPVQFDFRHSHHVGRRGHRGRMGGGCLRGLSPKATGCDTILAQMAAECMECDVEDVAVFGFLQCSMQRSNAQALAVS